MADVNFQGDGKPKSFWKRPEGLVGAIFLIAILAGLGILFVSYLPLLVELAKNVLYLTLMIIAGAGLLYMFFDPRMRNLVWYAYKSMMRSLTGMFVTIDPIGILKSYVEDLEDNLGKMRKQIGVLRGQMRKIQTLIEENAKEIENNMRLAQAARDADKDQQMLLASRKAARLQESNEKYGALYQKMEILYRILTKMHNNSEVLLEDTKDQVKVKEQERKAIRTAHGAMRSAMNVINGNADQRAIFDMSLEHIADDIANKVGEMEHFMDSTKNLMNSIDLQKGVFEAEGMKMLEEWEKKANVFTLAPKEQTLQLNANRPEKVAVEASNGQNQYDEMFKEAK